MPQAAASRHQYATNQALTVSKKTTWVTSDGVHHASKEAADQYILNDSLVEMLVGYGIVSAAAAQEAVDALARNRPLVRAFLDACDAVDPRGQ